MSEEYQIVSFRYKHCGKIIRLKKRGKEEIKLITCPNAFCREKK
ncbi:MAG: hypothetical protein ACTSP3_05865 [Candidatus Heimdallarchaeaceae archaeon]